MNDPSTPGPLRTLARGFLQIFYPNLCWVCGRSIPPEQHAFCPVCYEALFIDTKPACPRCAATVGPFVNVDNGCGLCRSEGFAFDGAVRLGVYEDQIRDVVLLLKQGHNESLAELVAEQWALRSLDKLRSLGIGSVVPVPLHWWRRWQRGYNQSEALARDTCVS
jgi:predicted amidophosphoribosyltransferase